MINLNQHQKCYRVTLSILVIQQTHGMRIYLPSTIFTHILLITIYSQKANSRDKINLQLSQQTKYYSFAKFASQQIHCADTSYFDSIGGCGVCNKTHRIMIMTVEMINQQITPDTTA